MNKLFLAPAIAMLSTNAFGVVVIQNNFDGVADDIGPAFQLFSNGAGGAGGGSFDPSTGVISTGTGTSGTNTGATGINNVALVTTTSTMPIIPMDATAITVVYDITSVAGVETIRSNGFFLGIATGTGATGTGSSALFNNDAASIGLRLFSNEAEIVRDGTSGGVDTLSSGAIDPGFAASIADGFTFTLTVRDDNTFDASTTGLSTNLAVTGGSIGSADPDFDAFITGGVGVNASIQGNGIHGGAPAAEFTVGSVEVFATVPEPSTSMLVGLASGLALFRRRRHSL